MSWLWPCPQLESSSLEYRHECLGQALLVLAVYNLFQHNKVDRPERIYRRDLAAHRQALPSQASVEYHCLRLVLVLRWD